ncbi:MAG TPA: hypothetical protein VF533_23960 [Solirubrobacteraceae bacterium]
MDERLIPINGLIALLRGDGGWPGLLRDQGFQRHQLEAPISSPLGDFRADAILYRLDPDLILLAECKSGRNIEEEQARKYVAVDAGWLGRAGLLPGPLRRRSDVEVRTLFVGREELRADLEAGLRALRIDAPLLTVGVDRVRLSGASAVSGLDDFDVHHSGGLPPARLPVDHQSPDEAIMEVLLPQIAAAQARLEDIVLIEDLCARIVPEWAILSRGTQGDFIRRVAALLRELQQGEFRGEIRYEPAPNARGRLVILDSPARRDPRGRTRAWQAHRDRSSAALRRPPAQRQIPGQLSLDELADSGGLAAE